VPNLIRVLGTAPAALEGYLNFGSALGGGSLNVRVREQIALAVAERNLCGYCLSAHTFLGGKVGLTEKDIVETIANVVEVIPYHPKETSLNEQERLHSKITAE